MLFGESPSGAMAKVQDRRLEVGEIELYLWYYVHFQTNT